MNAPVKHQVGAEKLGAVATLEVGEQLTTDKEQVVNKVNSGQHPIDYNGELVRMM